MNRLESQLDRGTYLRELVDCFDSPFALFSERVTGIVVGSFFSVAYYSPYEWNRRITSECNRAWGYVKEVDGKTEIRFVRGKGMFSPFWLLLVTALFWIMILVMTVWEGGSIGELFEESKMIWMFSIGCSIVICGITAFHASITEQGAAGAGEITRLLRDPKEYFC